MRNRFDEQLELLNVELIRMGALCEDAISYASRTLMGEGDFAEEVYKVDHEIDQKERDIENLCMRLLLQQQPVAKDLRQVSSALKMISDMERIGDQASDIAEICGFVDDREAKSRLHIRDMADATMRMVTQSIDSYVKRDLNIAKEVVQYDDVVDELFGKVKQELIGMLGSGNIDEKQGEFCIDMLMIAKYFERIGDHAMNLAEYAETIEAKGLQFSNYARKEFAVMEETCREGMELLKAAAAGDTQSPLSEVAEIEQRIDDITRKFRQNQIDRMREGNCNVESSILYSEMLTDYERIGDHMLNIAQAYDAIEWSGDRGQTAAAIA